MRAFLIGLIAFSTLSASLRGQTTAPHHPLDALTTQEYWTIHDVLEQSGHMTDKTLFSVCCCTSPPKTRCWPGRRAIPFPAKRMSFSRTGGKTIEARVDITARKLEFWKQVPGMQAPITESELDTMNDIVKKDPRVIAALKRHGVTDLVGRAL